MSLVIGFSVLAVLGAATRWGLGHLNLQSFGMVAIPVGTLIANASGSYLIGFIYSLESAGRSLSFSFISFSVIATAFLGSLTTFSGFALDTLRLYQSGFIMWGTANLVLNNALCLGLCWLGMRASN